MILKNMNIGEEIVYEYLNRIIRCDNVYGNPK